MAKKIAIITGTSSGLGREFVHETVKQYPDLDEIWVIARRKNRLDELAKKYPDKIRVLPWDLSKMETFDKLDESLKAEKPNVKLLVDDAGVMAIGNIADISLTDQANIVDVNARAYLAMARICLPYIHSAGSIIMIASALAFAPSEHVAVYTATKAFVLSLGQSLRKELKPRHINVLTVMPGPMDTEMVPRENPRHPDSPIYKLPFIDPSMVARKSLQKVRRGVPTYTTGLFYKCYRILCKLALHRILIFFNKI